MWNLGYFGVADNKKNTQKNVCLCYISLLCYQYIQNTISRKNYANLDAFLLWKIKAFSLVGYIYSLIVNVQILSSFVTLL